MTTLRQLIFILFFVYIIAAVLLGMPRTNLKTHPVLLKSLLSGSDEGYTIPGSELAIFKPYLPETGFFSFILDFPYVEEDEHSGMREFFWQAQNYVIPIILNRNPGESKALVFCSSEEIAEKRLEETGYVWSVSLGNGKGIAERKS